ncbi:MAG: PAS domain-containing protein [Acidobacteria bacterium]|nr:MAG: PAS domain-containing protein [Acidobacteriota bacterium]
MAAREPITLAVILTVALVLLSCLFAGVVYVAYVDAREIEARVRHDIERQISAEQVHLASWYEAVVQEHARQIAAPFLWDVETLEGLEEGSPAYQRLQRRMWQFVYGRDREPALPSQPVGPLESVLIIDRQHRIVAASDTLAVDRRFTDPEEVRLLETALHRPVVRRFEGERADGRPVVEVSVGVPNAKGEPIGVVRLRYVGGEISDIPALPRLDVSVQPRLLAPILAGIVALLGVAFGSLATYQVVALTRRLKAMARGIRLPPGRGLGREALSMIEERLESLSDAVRRDDLLVASLTDALREGVILFDPEGRPVIANRQAAEMFGVEGEGDEQLLKLRRLLNDNPSLAEVVRAAISRRKAVRERSLSLRVAGGEVAVQVTSYVLQDGERVAGVLLVIKDRASIEALERNLREASKLQAIVRLTGSVAHEVKNPLGAVRVHLEQLRRRLLRLAHADPTASERVDVLKEEIDRLHEILDEWLNFTSPDERAPAHARVTEVMHSVARLLRVEARHQGVDLVVEQEGQPGEVAVSTARLRQVLLNLALNALQAMPDGGRLTLGARPDGDAVVLTVADTGAGIPEEHRDRIFELHFTTREGGSGLGLPICQRVVEAAGGTIAFDSRPGEGTVFTIRLPSLASARRRVQSQEQRARGRLQPKQ